MQRNLHRVAIVLALLGSLVLAGVQALGSHRVPRAHVSARKRSQPRSARAATRSDPLYARSMWIWYLNASDGGRLRAIAGQARAAGIKTLIVKGADDSTRWAQLSARTVKAVHRLGLRICGWQYVYGSDPVAEGLLGAGIAATGVDCLVADAEQEYEQLPHPAAAARAYLRTVRAHVGPKFVLGVSSFPFAALHPSFPYRTFFSPGGAQDNLPQVYWRDLSETPGGALARTRAENSGFHASLIPVGQTAENPPAGEVAQFARLAGARSEGVSFWDWQETSQSGWQALERTASGASTRRGAPIGRRTRRASLPWKAPHLRTRAWGAIPTVSGSALALS